MAHRSDIPEVHFAFPAGNGLHLKHVVQVPLSEAVLLQNVKRQQLVTNTTIKSRHCFRTLADGKEIFGSTLCFC